MHFNYLQLNQQIKKKIKKYGTSLWWKCEIFPKLTRTSCFAVLFRNRNQIQFYL